MSLPFELSVADYARLRDSDQPPFLLDVREPDEYATAKISGSVLVPLSDITSRVQEVLPGKDAHIVVQCHHGMRSARAAEYLKQIGYQKVQNLTGGIDAWSVEIDPTVPVY
ncbi:MAG TPA: rhodanese-like domain-containing protein [Chthoniobacterales bacterium]|jgi:rhodanese-related sulfurtransferase